VVAFINYTLGFNTGKKNGEEIGKEKYTGKVRNLQDLHGVYSFLLLGVFKSVNKDPEQYLIGISFGYGGPVIEKYMFRISKEEHELLLLDDKITYGSSFDYNSNAPEGTPKIQRVIRTHHEM
jgi:hypothetical protein